MPDSARPSSPGAAWPAAVTLVARWLDRRERVDELFQALPKGVGGVERARCLHLVYGVVRHFSRIDAALERHLQRRPRLATQAILFIAGYELIEALGAEAGASAGHVAKVVHHAVEQAKGLASPAEAKMVNAVVRKLTADFAPPAPARVASAETLAQHFSHPGWLVQRWLVRFGAGPTRQLLEWNQQPASVHVRWRKAGPAPDWLTPTAWPGFFEVPPGRWPEVERLIAAGQVYVQDPATRLAVDLLAPQPGELVFDACGAPGGKSLLMADRMGSGRIVTFDLPGPRIERLKENLARTEGVDVALVQGDLRHAPERILGEHRLPLEYPAVMLDVPCSNTGVMRHRVDVKWRLQESDFRKHAEQQLALLHSAARLVAPGGRLVYSTCSIDPEENEKVVRAFFDSRAGGPFTLEEQVISVPWESGHDGAAAFRLRRKEA